MDVVSRMVRGWCPAPEIIYFVAGVAQNELTVVREQSTVKESTQGAEMIEPILLTTSFHKLRAASACTPRYQHLRTAMGPGYGDHKRINLLTVLEHNGIEDALWAMCATYEDCEKVARLMAADFAELALVEWNKYYPNDNRPALAVQAARDFANGLITDGARSAAESAAWSAAESAAWSAAWSAARSAARSAAESAAWSAARSAAESAAWSAQAEIFKRYLLACKEGN
jgi:hypothetical protein